MIKEAVSLPVIEPDVADIRTEVPAELVYKRADGTVEYAENAQDAIDRCPVLGKIALDSPDLANSLLELAAIGNAKLDEQKAEATNVKIEKASDTKISDVFTKAAKSPSLVSRNLNVENILPSEKLDDIKLGTIDTFIIQKPTDDTFYKKPVRSENLNDYIHVSKTLHAEETKVETDIRASEIIKEFDTKLSQATTDQADILASNHEPAGAIEITEIEHPQTPTSQDVPQEVSEIYNPLTAQINFNEKQTEDIAQELLDTTDKVEITSQDAFILEESIDQSVEANSVNIIELEEMNNQINADLEPSPEVVELFSVIADSANIEPLEVTLEILAESTEVHLENSEQMILEDIMAKIAEAVEILEIETNNLTEAIISPEVSTILEDIAELLGYAEPEVIIKDYLDKHSIEQLHQILYGLYKAYSDEDKKELFTKSFTDLRYLDETKLKISKHIFRLIIRGQNTTAISAA